MTDFRSMIVVCITCLAAVGVLAYCFIEWLRAFKRRNDLADKFQAYERAVETRILSLETVHADHEHRLVDLSNRHNNLLASQERVVSRLGVLDEETKTALKDLAAKWLAEVNEINTRQAAAFQQRAPNVPRFRP